MPLQIYLSDFGEFTAIAEHLSVNPTPHGVIQIAVRGKPLEIIHSGVTVLQSAVSVLNTAKPGASLLLLGSAGSSQEGEYRVIRSYYDCDFHPFRQRGECETMPFSVSGFGEIPGIDGFIEAESITATKFLSEIPNPTEIAVTGGLPLLYDVEDYGFLYAVSNLPENRKPVAAAILRTVTDSGQSDDFTANLKTRMTALFERVMTVV
jgi:hypothetical protein